MFDPERYVRSIMYRDFVSAWRWRRRRPEVSVADLPPQMDRRDYPDQMADRMALEDRLLSAVPARSLSGLLWHAGAGLHIQPVVWIC
jgi:DNA-directed RNA polymerase specialized sigma24 family protein